MILCNKPVTFHCVSVYGENRLHVQYVDVFLNKETIYDETMATPRTENCLIVSVSYTQTIF